ncbi:hypothetical protein [Streptomyces sp. NPDC001828]|uniref:hypothetical protein n=1 Tax=Streptomyces sp. NPDC001828 TaxID=3364615 RepID=UPI0036B6ED60
MSAMVNTWVRTSTDRLVRADRIVAVDLWGPPNGEKQTDVEHGEPARIMLQIDGDEEPWQEAATVNAERGGELITYLLSLLNSPLPDGSKVRYVYGLHRGEELYRWMHGASIPITPDGNVRPLHEVLDPYPGRGLVSPKA